MNKPTLAQHFESLPTPGGEPERQRQERIYQSIEGQLAAIREQQIAELKRLLSLPQSQLTLKERRSLHALRLKYPHLGGTSDDPPAA